MNRFLKKEKKISITNQKIDVNDVKCTKNRTSFGDQTKEENVI